MPIALAVLIELLLTVCLFWLILFFSTLLHELGHAALFWLSTGDGKWNIRVGSGKTLLDTKRLCVKLFPIDGFFRPLERRAFTKAQAVATLSGGPLVSLLLTVGLFLLSRLDFDEDLFLNIQSLVVWAFYVNAGIFLWSALPVPYFWGEMRGEPSDGLQILRTLRKRS